jgi:hypothetical protein
MCHRALSFSKILTSVTGGQGAQRRSVKIMLAEVAFRKASEAGPEAST